MILIVDDLEENLYSLKKTLEQHHFVVDTALSGREALKKILYNTYAVIILDVQMPEMDGFEVAEVFSGYSTTRDTAVIFLSSNRIDSDFIVKGYQTGAIDYITKPVDSRILIHKVQSIYKLFEVMQQKARQEEELRKVLERYSLVNQATNDIICDWDLSKNERTCNQKLFEVFGYPEQAISNSYEWWIKAIHPDDFKRVKEQFMDLVTRRADRWQLECRFRCVTGIYIHVFAQALLLYNRGGALERVILAIKDLSGLKQIETELESIEAKVNAIAFINSHEIRKPLANILSLVDILQNGSPGDVDEEVLGMLKYSAVELDGSIRKIASASMI